MLIVFFYLFLICLYFVIYGPKLAYFGYHLLFLFFLICYIIFISCLLSLMYRTSIPSFRVLIRISGDFTLAFFLTFMFFIFCYCNLQMFSNIFISFISVHLFFTILLTYCKEHCFFEFTTTIFLFFYKRLTLFIDLLLLFLSYSNPPWLVVFFLTFVLRLLRLQGLWNILPNLESFLQQLTSIHPKIISIITKFVISFILLLALKSPCFFSN